MGKAWPAEVVEDAMMTLMGKGTGPSEMPLDRIPECRTGLGKVISDKLGIEDVDPFKLDKLIENILRAVVDYNDEDPKIGASIRAARELLGFTRRSREEMALIVRDPTADLLPSDKEKGYNAKAVRLYLAGLHQRPPIKAHTAQGKQKTHWAPAMATALYHYLDDPETLAEAKKIAADLRLQFISGSTSGGASSGVAERSDPETANPAAGGPTRPGPRRRNLHAHLPQLSGEVREVLDAARDACKARRRRVYTFDVLLALLDMPSGRVRTCFEDAVSGLSRRVRDELIAMPAPGKQVHPFVPFDWFERDDVQLACEYAAADARPVISELHLLLAILDGQSATNRWLKRCCVHEHAQVRVLADRRRNGPGTIKSPTPS